MNRRPWEGSTLEKEGIARAKALWLECGEGMCWAGRWSPALMRQMGLNDLSSS